MIGTASENDLRGVACLRWRGVAEQGDELVMPQAEFERLFLAWAHEHGARTPARCWCVRGTVVGISRLAILPRGLSPRAPQGTPVTSSACRWSGSTVLPAAGGRGCWPRCWTAPQNWAWRVTVRSSADAVSAYTCAGLTASPRLMQTHPSRPGRPGDRESRPRVPTADAGRGARSRRLPPGSRASIPTRPAGPSRRSRPG